MKKLALILVAGASLLGTSGIASAQYYYGGGGHYGRPYYGDPYYPRRGYGYGGAIVGYDLSAGKNCITLSAAAVGARGATQSNRVSANRIVGTEIYLRA